MKTLSNILPLGAALFMLFALYGTFVYAPNEEVMGAVQRVFYFHVGSAVAAYLALAALLVSSATYLVTRSETADSASCALGGLAFGLCSIVLFTGMIWGYSAWNTWWRWEPRLTSFLVLWLTLLSYQILRGSTKFQEEVSTTSSVLGILAAINVPIVMFSVKFMDLSEQLHPEVVGRQGFSDVRFSQVLVLSIVAVLLYCSWFFRVSWKINCSERKLLELERLNNDC